MLDELFRFPIVMIDGDNEERKLKEKDRFGSIANEDDEDPELDIILGEAEYPYYDFRGMEDRWIPTSEGLQKALDGKFDACQVRFLHAGNLLVPWSKKKFRAELKKFIDNYELENPPVQTERTPQLRIMALTAEQFKKQMDDGEPKE